VAIASDPQVGQASVSVFTEVPQCRHSYTTSGCRAQDSTRSAFSNIIGTGNRSWRLAVPEIRALSAHCSCLCFASRDHVGRRDLCLKERTRIERWWTRCEHGLEEVMKGRESACDGNRVVVCLLSLLQVSYPSPHIGEPTTVKLKLEIR
jgi:hypothetical protein